MKLCPCNNPVFSKGLCIRCWKKKYGRGLKKTYRTINIQSKQKASQNGKYYRKRKKWLPENMECKAKLVGCTGITTEVHHMQGRLGDLLLDISKWLPVCHNCHQFITENSLEAIQLGLSLKRNV